MLYRSIVTHAQAQEDAQGFGLISCQLTLPRISSRVSRARLEDSWILRTVSLTLSIFLTAQLAGIILRRPVSF